MALTESDVQKIARLARLRLDTDEQARVADRLGSILGMVGRLQAIDTAGVSPMAHPLDAIQPLRADTITETDRHADYQAIAPAVENGLYLVPRVIE